MSVLSTEKRINYWKLLFGTETDFTILNETWDFCLESLVKEFYVFTQIYIDFYGHQSLFIRVSTSHVQWTINNMENSLQNFHMHWLMWVLYNNTIQQPRMRDKFRGRPYKELKFYNFSPTLLFSWWPCGGHETHYNMHS